MIRIVMAKHILNANNLTKRYGHKVAVSNVSLTVQSNEIVGLLGPNGAGKSTCFSMLAGLLKADSGKTLLDSKDITNLAMHLRSLWGLTYLPQEPSIFRELSTQDNLKALIEYRKDLGPEQKIDFLNILFETHKLSVLETKLVYFPALLLTKQVELRSLLGYSFIKRTSIFII